MRYLQHNWRNQNDIKDILQDVYVRVCEAAQKDIPRSTKPFVFTTARNLLINRVRDSQVIPIEAVADLDALMTAADEPGPDLAPLRAMNCATFRPHSIVCRRDAAKP